jgi:hypothetical protein
MSAIRNVNVDIDREFVRCGYEPGVLQFEGTVHFDWPGPLTVAVLHTPSTASSGLSDTCVNSGF